MGEIFLFECQSDKWLRCANLVSNIRDMRDLCVTLIVVHVHHCENLIERAV